MHTHTQNKTHSIYDIKSILKLSFLSALKARRRLSFSFAVFNPQKKIKNYEDHFCAMSSIFVENEIVLFVASRIQYLVFVLISSWCSFFVWTQTNKKASFFVVLNEKKQKGFSTFCAQRSDFHLAFFVFSLHEFLIILFYFFFFRRRRRFISTPRLRCIGRALYLCETERMPACTSLSISLLNNGKWSLKILDFSVLMEWKRTAIEIRIKWFKTTKFCLPEQFSKSAK